MRVGRHDVYWHRPLIAYQDAHSGQATVMYDGPLGYLTAYDSKNPNLPKPIELWPRLLQREPHLTGVSIYDRVHAAFPHHTSVNVRKLLDSRSLLGDMPLPHSFAVSLVNIAAQETLESWLTKLPSRAPDLESGQRLADELRGGIGPVDAPLPEPLTYQYTARRDFEVKYWKMIASLAEGKYLTQNNADCVRDAPTQKHLVHHHRDLDALGEFILSYYRKTVAAAGMTGKARRRRSALFLENGVSLPVDGRLAQQSRRPPRRARFNCRHSRARSTSGGHHGGSLRYSLHGRPL